MRAVIKSELEALLEDGHVVDDCALRRAKFKPGRKLTAYYDVDLRDAAGRVIPPRPIAVTWGAAFGEASPAAAGAAPFRMLEARCTRLGMRILVSPFDERFPELATLSDPRCVAELAGRPVASVTPVRYRPGQRHVLAYDEKGGSERFFGKISQANADGGPFRAAAAAGHWLDEVTAAIRPFAQSGRAVFYPVVRGVPVSHEIVRRASAVPAELHNAGALLRRLHLMPGIDGLHDHGFAAEVAATARASEHVGAFSPRLERKIQHVLASARALHGKVPQEPPGFVHGDFKCDHVLVSPDETLTLIDFDSARTADAALDVGKMLADLHWWHQGRTESAFERAQRWFLDGYAPEAPPVRILRARLYEAVLLVKIAVRRVPVFDASWTSSVWSLVGRAESVVARATEEGDGARRARFSPAAKGCVKQASSP
jgi:hypothetical protein